MSTTLTDPDNAGLSESVVPHWTNLLGHWTSHPMYGSHMGPFASEQLAKQAYVDEVTKWEQWEASEGVSENVLNCREGESGN